MPDLIPTIENESKFGYPNSLVIGVDEVGRGCLAGPVMAGAYLLPREAIDAPPSWLSQVRDSKLLSSKVREELAPKLESWTPYWAVGTASVEEIDRVNILNAVGLAMERAVFAILTALRLPPDSPGFHVLIDGNRTPQSLRAFSTAIVKGDAQCLSIACASVIAKVRRDHLLAELDRQNPGYGLSVHKGYGTPAHLEALRRLRPVAGIHRMSFSPVRQAAL